MEVKNATFRKYFAVINEVLKSDKKKLHIKKTVKSIKDGTWLKDKWKQTFETIYCNVSDNVFTMSISTPLHSLSVKVYVEITNDNTCGVIGWEKQSATITWSDMIDISNHIKTESINLKLLNFKPLTGINPELLNLQNDRQDCFIDPSKVLNDVSEMIDCTFDSNDVGGVKFDVENKAMYATNIHLLKKVDNLNTLTTIHFDYIDCKVLNLLNKLDTCFSFKRDETLFNCIGETFDYIAKVGKCDLNYERCFYNFHHKPKYFELRNFKEIRKELNKLIKKPLYDYIDTVTGEKKQSDWCFVLTIENKDIIIYHDFINNDAGQEKIELKRLQMDTDGVFETFAVSVYYFLESLNSVKSCYHLVHDNDKSLSPIFSKSDDNIAFAIMPIRG
jgi:hypothetical protein